MKRSRSSQACVRCHDRKVKCNIAIQNPCSNCQLSDSVCTLYERKKRKKTTAANTGTSAKSSLSSVSGSPKLVDNLNHILDHNNLHPTKPLHGSFLTPNLQQRFSHLSHTQLDPEILLKKDMNRVMSSEFDVKNASMKPVFDNCVSMITENKRSRSYSLDELDFEVLKMFGCLSIPDDETCWKYIDSFFESMNVQYPIINKKKFYQSYANLKNPPSLMLLNAVLYVGAWHYNGTFDQREESLRISTIFFKRAKLLYDYGLETDPIPLIQSLLCFVYHSDNMSSLCKNDYYWTKTAIIVAYQYKLHMPPTKGTIYERQMKLRLWWLLIIKDRLTALGYSKPTIIQLDNDELIPLTSNDLKNSGMSKLECDYFIQLTKFAILLGRIFKLQSEINKLASQKKPVLELMKKCDTMLIDYFKDVPHDLKIVLDDESTHSFLSSLMTGLYYAVVILVHKANIMRKSADNYPSWAISFQAVQMIKAVLDCFSKKNMINRVALFPHNILSSAAIIMLYHLSNKDPNVSKIAHDFFLRVLLVWQHSSQKWPGSYPILCLFGQVYNSESIRRSLLNSIAPANSDQKVIDPMANNDLSIVFEGHNSTLKSKFHTKNISDLGIDFDQLFGDKVFITKEDDVSNVDLDFIKKSKSKIFHGDSKSSNPDAKDENENVHTELVFDHGEITNLKTATLKTFNNDSNFRKVQKDWQPKFNFYLQDESQQFQQQQHEQQQQQYEQQQQHQQQSELQQQKQPPFQQQQHYQQQPYQQQYQQHYQHQQQQHQHQHQPQHQNQQLPHIQFQHEIQTRLHQQQIPSQLRQHELQESQQLPDLRQIQPQPDMQHQLELQQQMQHQQQQKHLSHSATPMASASSVSSVAPIGTQHISEAPRANQPQISVPTQESINSYSMAYPMMNTVNDVPNDNNNNNMFYPERQEMNEYNNTEVQKPLQQQQQQQYIPLQNANQVESINANQQVTNHADVTFNNETTNNGMDFQQNVLNDFFINSFSANNDPFKYFQPF